MKTTARSLIVATESHIPKAVPIFHTNPSNDFSPVGSPYLSNVKKFFFNECREEKQCRCPDVLIADDDSFQHMYYHMLFQKSLTNDGSDPMRVEMCFSGEEMLEKLSKIITCGCRKLKLVITDYHMGNNKLNGVETSVGVRGHGYTGAIILRTSEVYEDLQAKHGELDKLCSENTISKFVSKSDLMQSKAIIQSYIRK